MDWDEYFMNMSYLAASRSKDPSTKVGAVIVGPDKHIRGSGYNGIPVGIEYTPSMFERPIKYFWFEHAERNAIYAAAKRGQALEGCTLYTGFIPCVDCARGIIQSGIVEIVINKLEKPCKSSSEEMRTFVKNLFRNCNVKLREIEVNVSKWKDLE